MTKKPLKILGINPGTRHLGIAILQDSELRDWRIKVTFGKWSSKKLEKLCKTILELFESYLPNIMVIKKLNPIRCSPSLQNFTNRIIRLSNSRGIIVFRYSIDELEEFFLADTKKNKQNLVKRLLSEYPELAHEFSREKRLKNSYYMRMFEAVALASRCFYQLDH